MSSARSRTPSARPRRTVRSVLAGIVALVLATGGLVLASALPAQAHNTNYTVTCQALTITIDSFRPSDGPDKTNHLTVTVDGRVVKDEEFSVQPGDGTVVIPFSDPTAHHTWSFDVFAFDDDGHQNWTQSHSGDQGPCTSPTITAHASTCTAVGGSSAITADITGIAPADAYRVELISGGATLSTHDYAPGELTSPLDFGPRAAGAVYTVKVTDLTVAGLGAENTVTAGSCPQVGDVFVEISPCTTVGGDAVLTITSSDGFVNGRTYQVHEGSTTGPAVGSPFTAGAATTYQVQVTPNGTEFRDFYLVDVDSGVPVSTSAQAVQVAACPTQPRIVSATVETCSVGQSVSDVTVTLADLTEGRTYRVVVGSLSEDVVATSAATQKVVLQDVAPGDYTLSVSDLGAPDVTATQPVTVDACPLVPVTRLDPAQCTSVGGSGSVNVTVGDLVVGRSYTVSVSSPASSTIAPVTFTATAATETFPFPNLPAGASYSVDVVDDLLPSVSTTSTFTLAGCPQVAALSFECTTSANVATLAVAASDLTPGHTFTVRIERQTGSGGFALVSEKTDLATVAPSDLRISGVVPGQVYRVSVIDQTNAALTDSVVVPVPDGCTTGHVGGVSYTAGGSVSALALTGTDTGRLALLALLLLIPGAGLIGFAVLRHRKEVGD